MSSAAKVGEIFTKAGDSYNKLGTMIMRLHPTGQELTALEEAVAKQEKEAREKLQQRADGATSNGSSAILSTALTENRS